jgi:regulator of nucleoside diphosphate kinase
MRDRIYITKADHERLRRLVEGRRAENPSDLEYLDILEQELDRADIVEPDAIPRDVVTMNSEVRLKDLDAGGVRVYRLVFPSQARRENGISVLAPIGTAILGYRAGDVIEWRVPKGVRRLQVVEVLYQPEAAGVYGAAHPRHAGAT